MTAAVTDTSPSSAQRDSQCDCRHVVGYDTFVQCPEPAVYVYQMRCCGRRTLVCKGCREFHITFADMVFHCRWCDTVGDVDTLVLYVSLR